MVPNPSAELGISGGSPRGPRVQEPPTFAWMFALAAALFALALPIVGPLEDHHFAERSHSHDHIYLNGMPVAHGHAYDGLALHPHWKSQPDFARPASWATDQAVLYLVPATAALTLAALNGQYHPAPEALRPPPPTDGMDNPLERFAPASNRLQAAIFPPPLPPPIV